ncbi:hypothetical protein [Gloeothece verrucosa]|uniref:Uncharacterized protein n=1 Tax=Gloeothece verrucosa (strain PCC 7822) TaxID=497965 RepID=E0U756_GLOV7|nr:hypothetical protein [Gloeothece verrucosa]ADN17212.1 hypothetical protein Cyan7822_5333 [Gloeothece verrucosa PCC 7822]
MATYKCKDCSHEIISIYRPAECDICGGNNLITLGTKLAINKGEYTMAINKDIFSSNRFRSTIQGYCREIGWNILDINDNKAVLVFQMSSGNSQTLYIIRYENTLEFSCPSGVKFDDIDDIPHQLSTWLLIKNSKFKIGFWCIEEIGGRQVFSIMHNAEMSLIDVNYFNKVVLKLINDCDEFEEAIESALH